MKFFSSLALIAPLLSLGSAENAAAEPATTPATPPETGTPLGATKELSEKDMAMIDKVATKAMNSIGITTFSNSVKEDCLPSSIVDKFSQIRCKKLRHNMILRFGVSMAGAKMVQKVAAKMKVEGGIGSMIAYGAGYIAVKKVIADRYCWLDKKKFGEFEVCFEKEPKGEKCDARSGSYQGKEQGEWVKVKGWSVCTGNHDDYGVKSLGGEGKESSEEAEDPKNAAVPKKQGTETDGATEEANPVANGPVADVLGGAGEESDITKDGTAPAEA